jgi:hypothetical protein
MRHIDTARPRYQIVQKRGPARRHQGMIAYLHKNLWALPPRRSVVLCLDSFKFGLHPRNDALGLPKPARCFADLPDCIEQFLEVADSDIQYADAGSAQHIGNLLPLQSGCNHKIGTQSQQFFHVRRAELADPLDAHCRRWIVATVRRTNERFSRAQREKDFRYAWSKRDNPQLAAHRPVGRGISAAPANRESCGDQEDH